MHTRDLAAKLFLGLAILAAVVGAFLYRDGLPGGFYWDLLSLFLFPRLIPFAVAILSACFALVYFGLEKKVNHPANVPLTVVHLVFFLLAVLGHTVHTLWWWRVLGQDHPINETLPMWSVLLSISAFAICCLAFVVNIFWTLRRTLPKDYQASSPYPGDGAGVVPHT